MLRTVTGNGNNAGNKYILNKFLAEMSTKKVQEGKHTEKYSISR